MAAEAENLVARALATLQWEGWRPVEIAQSFECVSQSQPMLAVKGQGRRDCGHVSPHKASLQALSKRVLTPALKGAVDQAMKALAREGCGSEPRQPRSPAPTVLRPGSASWGKTVSGGTVANVPGTMNHLSTMRTWEPILATETRADGSPEALMVSPAPKGLSTILACLVRIGTPTRVMGGMQGALAQFTLVTTKELALPTLTPRISMALKGNLKLPLPVSQEPHQSLS